MKAVIFDMDGVLINSELYYVGHNLEYIRSKGSKASKEDILKIVGSSMKKTYEMIYQLIEDKMTFQQFKEDYDHYYQQLHVDYRQMLNPHVKETLQSLKARGFLVALASSSDRKDIDLVIDQCQLHGIFEVILSGDQFIKNKPDPQIYLCAAKQLKVDPKECYVVEDSTVGIEAGKKAGMRVIAMKEPFGQDQSRAELFAASFDELIEMIK